MAKKKVVDIYPPSRKKERPLPAKKEKDVPLLRAKKKTKKISLKKKGLTAGGILFLVLSVIFCSSLSRAEVKIWPETKDVEIETELIIDKNAKEIDVSSKTAPGEIFEKENVATETFAASGTKTKEGKAEGTIRVFNEYSTSPQFLLATTRFISADGHLFRTPAKVTIKGASYEGQKLVSGYTDIRVVANEPGPEYNIGPTTFSIPGFAGSARYTKFYAKSFQTMAGGFINEVSIITKKDIEDAERAVSNRAKSECEGLFRSELEIKKNNEKIIYFENAIQTGIVSTAASKAALAESEEFEFESKAKAKTLIFSESDLKSFVKSLILMENPEGYEVYEEGLEISYTTKNINIESGKIVLNLKISAKVYPGIDIKNLKGSLAGKSVAGTKIFIENQNGVSKTEVGFWPFWVRKAPNSLDKIEIELKID